jgi:drug/metabolite transporter (DMT)-like permease
MFFGSLPFLPFVIKELQTWSFSQVNFTGSFGLFYGLFFSSATAYGLYYFGLSKIKAEEIGLFSYIDPVIAIIIAAPLLGEIPDNFFILGALFIFWGIYIAERRIHWHPFHKLKK